MARTLVRPDERQAHIPGSYRHLLKLAQDEHDRPDPRTMYWDDRVVSPEERDRLVAEAKWRNPSMWYAKRGAGQPVTVRKYQAIPSSRRRQIGASVPWLSDPTTIFVTVTKNDMVCPGE